MQAALWRQLCDEVSDALQATGRRKVLLALSGGLDSMLLLELLTAVAPASGLQLSAAHVCHQLQSQAQDWLIFCQQQCQQRQVPYQALTVALRDPRRNIEQQARTLRYQALAALVDSDTVLLTAHHADDQLETMLLALKRGSGLTGLAGIARSQPFGAGVLLRPLLAFSRAELAGVANWRALAYVDDPSNLDISFDRNFLRQQIIPLLTERFATLSQTASRSATLLQQSLAYQQQQLTAQLAPLLAACGRLRLSLLAAQAQPAQDLLLRHYLAGFALNPSQQQLQQISQMFVAARPDTQPQLQLGPLLLRRFDDRLFIDPPAETNNIGAEVNLHSGQVLQLAAAGLELCWQAQPLLHWQQVPLPQPLADTSLTLSFGRLNRRFRPYGNTQSKALKDWCKVWKVPPWRRGILPFVIAGQQKDQIVAVLAAEAGDAVSQCSPLQAQSWLNWRALQ